jgi:hypothetical protein
MTKNTLCNGCFLNRFINFIQSLQVKWTVFVSSHVAGHKFLRRCPWRFHAILNGPLKASERPSVSRSFSVEDVWTSEQYRPDSRSSFSNFYTELDFSRHYLESFYKTFGRHGNTSGCYPAFQNILSFLYGRGKEWQWRPSGHLAKPSWRGPIMGRIALFWKGNRWRSFGRG